MPNLPFLLILLSSLVVSSFTPPFTQPLKFGQENSQIRILQGLLARVYSGLPLSGKYEKFTALAVKKFKSESGCQKSGSIDDSIMNQDCLNSLLKLHLQDGYRDPAPSWIPAGYKYKVHITVYSNRSIETFATIYGIGSNKTSKGQYGTALHKFKTHTHGQNDENGNQLNSLSPNGCTPTGLMALDWNGPEPDPKDFGPYPVNRMIWAFDSWPPNYPTNGVRFPSTTNSLIVTGTETNNKIGSPHPIRWGILIHTGEWPGWAPPMEMPNSHGCVHCWPNDIRTIWMLATHNLGVDVRYPNPGGQWPYIYAPQGILSIEEIKV